MVPVHMLRHRERKIYDPHSSPPHRNRMLWLLCLWRHQQGELRQPNLTGFTDNCLSKLRSESLVQLDPRATTMTEPVHQRVGRDNPSNGRTTKEASLAGRLGQPVTNSRSQPAVGRRQLAAGGGSLFERLGKPAGGRAGNDAMDLN